MLIPSNRTSFIRVIEAFTSLIGQIVRDAVYLNVKCNKIDAKSGENLLALQRIAILSRLEEENFPKK